ncbi:MAG TPA: ArsC/Spx/MgsR family protein [Longimicrobiales bacterium]
MSEKKVRVYQKPTCTTCKNLMMLLKDKGIDFERIDYMIDPIPRAKLQDLVRKMGGSPRDLIRTKEPEYRSLGLDRSDISDDEVLDALASNPRLVQRPIVEIDDRAIVARPAERVNEIL